MHEKKQLFMVLLTCFALGVLVFCREQGEQGGVWLFWNNCYKYYLGKVDINTFLYRYGVTYYAI